MRTNSVEISYTRKVKTTPGAKRDKLAGIIAK